MSNKYPGGIITSGANAGYSVAFDGTGDYLTVANNTALQMGTGDFQVEAWVYTTNASAFQSIICIGISTGGSTAGTFTLRVQNDLKVRWCINDNSTGLTSTNAITVNTWTHVCVSRVSGTTRIFLNGVSNGSLSDSTNYNNTSGTMIGAENQSGAVNTMYGYISNLRVVKGSGVTSLNVPTQLVNISGTSLLTCNSPAIVDQSSNNFTITANGNAAVSTFTPFQGYVAYNPALGAATPGIWTVSDAIQAAQTRRWNMYDPYFNLTTLLLHGNGTNGAQNNTFLDSSSNNFTITRNGNTTQGTFSPFSQTGWSNHFNGSSLLTVPANNAFVFGTGDFTIELWIYQTAAWSTNNIINNVSSGNTSWSIDLTAGNIYFSGWNVTFLNGGTQPSINAWHHIAVCRSGTTLSMFIDGIRTGTTTNSTNFSSNNTLSIGGFGGFYYTTGYLSNVRLVKGTAVYNPSSSTCTVPTSPLTAISGTSILTCQSNRFIDNSSNAFTVSVGEGTPSVQAFSPFYPVVAYTPQAQGGSGYFDGTGDFLSFANNAAFTFGTGDFTIEAWIYRVGTGSGSAVYESIIGGNTSATAYWNLYVNSSNNTIVFYDGTIRSTSTSIVNNTWNHVAVSRSGTTLQIYINGVSGYSAAVTTSLSLGASGGCIGADIAGTGNKVFYGYISSLRVLKGTAQYTGNFTPPTAPPTAIANTSLLTNFTNAGIIDSTGDNVLETVGNAQISTTQSKFGGSSLYFDGTGDYLVLPDSPSWYLGNTFTIEAWIYPISTSGYKTICAHVTSGWYFSISSGRLESYDFTVNKAVNSATSSISTNVWQHVALVCNAGTALSVPGRG